MKRHPTLRERPLCEACEIRVTDVVSAYADRACPSVVLAQQQAEDRGFAGTARADNANRLTGRDLEAQTDMGVAVPARVGEPDDLEGDTRREVLPLRGAPGRSVALRFQKRNEWAQTQNNLASAYVTRIRGERADNIEKVIGALEVALTVFTREALPIYWADTQNNLAVAYRERIRGGRADNLEMAIAAYERALTVRTRKALPRHHLRTARLLGSNCSALWVGVCAS
jgi:Tetratricopeptide repeat